VSAYQHQRPRSPPKETSPVREAALRRSIGKQIGYDWASNIYALVAFALTFSAKEKGRHLCESVSLTLRRSSVAVNSLGKMSNPPSLIRF
jgi:hypothetical protein